MNLDNPELKSTHHHFLTSIFDWMPVCALVIDQNGIIQEVNEQAIQFFRATTKEDFIFDKQNLINMIVDTHRGNEIIKQIGKSLTAINLEILIRRFDKSIVSVDFYASQFPSNPKFILLQFIEKKPHSQVYMYELSQAFRREAQRLKPYLNKPGKSILEDILITDMVECMTGNKTLTKNQAVVISDERLHKLTQHFPEFSKQELIICGYLSLKITIDEIATLIGKTPNSLRVSFHRILKKTTFDSGKKFLRVLESI